MKKVLGIVLGILMSIGGIYCLTSPAATYATVSMVFAIVLVENAIGYFFIWNEERKVGISDGWQLVSAILSLVGGIFLASNFAAQLIVDAALLGVIAGFMVAFGITRIVDSFKLKKVITGNAWIFVLISGILITVAGVLSLINPAALAITIGVNMGINIFLTGIALIVLTFAVDYTKEKIETDIQIAKKIIEEKVEEYETIKETIDNK